MLMDTSGTYKKQLNQAKTIINYLLATLQPGDSFAVARIDSGSFSEKNIIAKIKFDQRPSLANKQKLNFKKKIDDFIVASKGSQYTDIIGGILQAVEYLNESCVGKKYILIFSDLKEELLKGHVRNFPINVKDVNVVALNVTKLHSDSVDPRRYYKRVEKWKKKVVAGGGQFKVMNDLEHIHKIITK